MRYKNLDVTRKVLFVHEETNYKKFKKALKSQKFYNANASKTKPLFHEMTLTNKN